MKETRTQNTLKLIATLIGITIGWLSCGVSIAERTPSIYYNYAFGIFGVIISIVSFVYLIIIVKRR
jgi:hypothetical protein